MIINGIVHSHIVLSTRIEVNKPKIKLIINLPTPKYVKDVRSFLGHAGFYRSFIKDFSLICKSLGNLLIKDNVFEWIEYYEEVFVKLNNMCTFAIVIQPPDQSLPFKIICDASDYTIGVALGQIKNKKSYVIYYASKTLNNAHINYSTTKNEFLAYEKYRSYLFG